MRIRLFLALGMACLLVPTAVPGEEKAGENLKAFNGAWGAEEVSRGERSIKDDFKGVTWTLEDGKVTFTDGKSTRTHKITVDSSKNPKTIDFHFESGADKDKKSLGIYRFDGPDRLILCWAEPGKERPTKFESKEDAGILKQVLVRKK
jgi:uncharacterized protein (TIGR03067 family)